MTPTTHDHLSDLSDRLLAIDPSRVLLSLMFGPAEALIASESPTAERDFERVSRAIESRGFRVRVGRNPFAPASAEGSTCYATNTVHIDPDLSPTEALKVLTHEFAHVLMHDPFGPFRRIPQRQAEVEAETVAYALSRHLGIECSADFTVGYVLGYTGGDVAETRGFMDTPRVRQAIDAAVSMIAATPA